MLTEIISNSIAYALRTHVHDSTGKNPAELFLGRKIITTFQRLVIVSDSYNKFACQDENKLATKTQLKISEE